MITCLSSETAIELSKRQQENLGIYAPHAYTLLKIYENLPNSEGKVTLLKLRNPWGKKGWKGKWSYGSSTWTPLLK